MLVERWTDEMQDEIAETLKEASRISQENTEVIRQLREESKATYEAIRQYREESKALSICSNAFQQATQWVVNLVFGLLAMVSITTIVTALLRK